VLPVSQPDARRTSGSESSAGRGAVTREQISSTLTNPNRGPRLHARGPFAGPEPPRSRQAACSAWPSRPARRYARSQEVAGRIQPKHRLRVSSGWSSSGRSVGGRFMADDGDAMGAKYELSCRAPRDQRGAAARQPVRGGGCGLPVLPEGSRALSAANRGHPEFARDACSNPSITAPSPGRLGRGDGPWPSRAPRLWKQPSKNDPTVSPSGPDRHDLTAEGCLVDASWGGGD
jgi:hypothetical protein